MKNLIKIIIIGIIIFLMINLSSCKKVEYDRCGKITDVYWKENVFTNKLEKKGYVFFDNSDPNKRQVKSVNLTNSQNLNDLYCE